MTLITSAGTWCLKHTLHLPSHDPPHASPHASPPPLLDIHPVDPCPVSCFVLSAGPGFPLVSLPPFPHSLPSLTRASSSSSSFFHPLSNPRYHSRTSYTNPHVSVHARISPSRPPILLFSSSLCLCCPSSGFRLSGSFDRVHALRWLLYFNLNVSGPS